MFGGVARLGSSTVNLEVVDILRALTRLLGKNRGVVYATLA